jgi:hypothetical protein
MATEKSSLEIEVKAKGVKDTTKKIDNLNKEISKTPKKQKAAKKAIDQTTKATVQLQQASGGALNAAERMNRSAGNMGQKAGLAAIQIEQLVGQIAGGQNPMRAFGQQSADIGFVLGTPMLGAIIGVSSALTSLLIPVLLDTGKTTEELITSSEELASAFTLNEIGVAEFSTSLIELHKQMKPIAEAQAEIAKLRAFEVASQGTEKLIKLTDKLTVTTGRYSRPVAIFGVAGKKLEKLDDHIVALQSGTKGSELALVSYLKEIAATEKVTPEFTKLFDEIIQVVKATETANRILNVSNTLEEASAKKKTKNVKVTARARKEEISDFDKKLKQLMVQNALLNDEQDLALQLSTTFNASQREQIIALMKKNEVKREELKIEADKDKKAKQSTERRKSENIKLLEQLKKSSMTQTELLTAEYTRRLEAINELQDAEVISVLIANRRKLEAEQIYSAALLKMRTEAALKIEQAIAEIEARSGNSNEDKLNANQLYWTEWLKQSTEAMISFNDITGAGINTFEQGFSRAFENIIMDGQGIKGAISGVFEAMARDQLSALGQMAAQRLQHFVVGQALQKTAAATSAATTISNATAKVAEGSINAASSAAAIPLIGWKIAPLAAAAFIGATAGYLASVKSKSNAGASGRALGGQVRGGESYLVGERGPEMLTMPSNRMGRITPNSSMGGGQLNVTVENYGSSNISVQKISETDVRIIAREVATQTVQREAPRVIASDISNPNGRVSKTLANNTNTQRRR